MGTIKSFYFVKNLIFFTCKNNVVEICYDFSSISYFVFGWVDSEGNGVFR